MPAPYPTELERRLKAAYGNHRRIARMRGIPFLFTFEQWSEWWLTDDRWSRRGRKAGQLQMGRKGNSGPYAPENVECVTKEQKQKSQLIALSVSALSPERRAETARKVWPCSTRRKPLVATKALAEPDVFALARHTQQH